MKVCIIGHTERNYLPYMEKYVRFFAENGVECDIICWQREEKNVHAAPGEYHFCEPIGEGAPGKLRSYLRFRKFVIGILERNQYDKLVVLTTVPAIVLKGYLKKHYRGRYLFDFRDYSFEKFGPYRKAVDALIEDSELTTISSHGFLDFLSPNPKITMNHNIAFQDIVEEAPDLSEKQVINIGFIGGVRYFDENTFLIDKLKNTFRYQLWYIGQPTKDCDLQSYCEAHGVTNVSFIGKYDNAQKPELYRSIDVINSIYGNTSLEVTTALPNRLYEACLFKKPIISSKGTYLGEVIQQYRLGVVVDAEFDDVLAVLDDYINHFNAAEFREGCEAFLRVVRRDEDKLAERLREFIAE